MCIVALLRFDHSSLRYAPRFYWLLSVSVRNLTVSTEALIADGAMFLLMRYMDTSDEGAKN